MFLTFFTFYGRKSEINTSFMEMIGKNVCGYVYIFVPGRWSFPRGSRD